MSSCSESCNGSDLSCFSLTRQHMFVGLERIVLGDIIRIDNATANTLVVKSMKVVARRPKLIGRAITICHATNRDKSDLPPPPPGFAWQVGSKLVVNVSRVLGRYHPPTTHADWIGVECRLVEGAALVDDPLLIEAAAAGLGPAGTLPMSVSFPGRSSLYNSLTLSCSLP